MFRVRVGVGSGEIVPGHDLYPQNLVRRMIVATTENRVLFQICYNMLGMGHDRNPSKGIPIKDVEYEIPKAMRVRRLPLENLGPPS